MTPRLLSLLAVSCALAGAWPASALDKGKLLKELRHSPEMQKLQDEIRDTRDKDEKKELRQLLHEEQKAAQEASAACGKWISRQKEGFDINWQDDDGCTLVMLVAASGNVAAINLVLDENPRLDLTDEEGKTAAEHAEGKAFSQCVLAKLETAIREGDSARVANLVKSGLPLKPRIGYEPAVFHVLRGGSPKMLELLLTNGLAPLDSVSKDKENMLETAIIYDNSEAIRLLLKNGMDVKAPFHNGSSPLYYIATHGNPYTLKAYLEAYQEMDVDMQSALPSVIVRYGTEEMVRNTLTGSDQANQEDSRMNIPVHEAARRGDTAILRYVLEQGGSRTATNAAGESTLMHAALGGNPEAVRIVLEGLTAADVNIKDNAGRTAADYARESGYTEITRLLEEAAKAP